MKLKEISEEYRPRERFSRGERLSEAELLALVIQKGTRGENVVDLCNRIISKFGIDRLKDVSLKELQSVKGIGIAKSIQIKAIFEFGNRCLYVNNNPIIKSAQDVYSYCYPKMKDLDREVFMILLLDTKNRVIRSEIVSVGSLNSCISHPREVFKSAIKESCNSLILVHNHPSGDVSPSQEDIQVSKKLMDAGELLGIKVLDHIVVGSKGWWSFQEQQL